VKALPKEVIARIRAIAERQLSPEEFDAAWRVPIGGAERQDILSLIAWFTRRYPTPAERLVYVRRAYANWKRSFPPR